jgi:hypothetical protein
VAENASKLWPDSPVINGVDFNQSEQKQFLSDCVGKYACDFNYPDESDTPGLFYCNNGQFNRWDSMILFALMRYVKPARIVEVGSGFSSTLMADINIQYFSGDIDIRCVEPYPREFLEAGITGINRLYKNKVQDVDVSVFKRLCSGDILFIDSSHVTKTGSDVNQLFFNVLPLLNKGVYVHVHDIFFPEDYKKDWVLGEGRSWNEQYLLQALLMYNSAFKVVFGANYALHAWPEVLHEIQGMAPVGGGSFWMRKII